MNSSSRPTPPRWTKWLLTQLHPDDTLEEVEGDLDELYIYWYQRAGRTQATLRYLLNVVTVLPPFVRRRQRKEDYYQLSSLSPAMLRNYLKIAVRSLLKNKVSSFINVFGLTTGLSACLLISLYVQHEASFDRFQAKGNRLALVIMEYSFKGNPEPKRGNFTSTKVAPVFARTFPEIETGVRMKDLDRIVQYNDKLVNESNFLFADSTFFAAFYSPLRLGNPHTALSGPYKVVLTESTAKRYFGSNNPLGKVLLIGTDAVPYQVTGIMGDYPTNSQLQFDFLASFSSLKANQEETYFEANYTTYLLLKNSQSLASLQPKVTAFMKKEMADSGASIDYVLEPFDKIHLHSEYEGMVPNTSIANLYILSAVAFLILVIVGFTYVNLSTARSIERAKEVGVRKAVGARKPQLFWQFIGESAIVCFVAVSLSILVVMLLLPAFNTLTQKQLSIQTLFSPTFLLFTLLIAVVISLSSGSYPALILSGFQPVRVLKGVFQYSGSSKRVQQSLIVFQFAVSVALIVSTFIIQQQLYFIQHKKLGYNRDHVLVLPMNEKMLNNIATIKQELMGNLDIKSVSRCISSPVQIGGGYNMRTATMPENGQIGVTATPVDKDYIKTTGLQIIAGKDLTEQDDKDVLPEKPEERIYHFVLNKSAARQLGWAPEQAVDKPMFMGYRKGFVKAVINDFHFESMRTSIKPVVLFTENRGRQLLVKVSGQNLPGTIAFIEQTWKQLVPYVPFDYRFLDDDYARLYQSERQLGTVMSLFASLAIVLACLGLFGLSSYVVQQRVKEIGIRKILGASLTNIVGLLAGNFIKLVAIGLLIAFPIAYVLMDKWLRDFAYQIAISWWMFAGAGLLTILIALLTVSFQSIKAALVNPVKSLRSE